MVALPKKLGHITLRGDAKEHFFSYDYNKHFFLMATILLFNENASTKHF